jgi:D-serine deaminase-like pyridoxal phosphate-dependent protein
MTLDELDTPFLTVDLDAVERNVRAMQDYCDTHGLALRPHVKTHKLPLVADLQLRAGAVGLTCQKLGEAEVMARHGCDDILITFPLVGSAKAARFAELAANVRMAVGADSAVVARSLSTALAAAGCTARFLVDCDTGYHRTGVQSAREAAELAELVDSLPGLELGGLMTHPSGPESGAWLAEARRVIEQRGLPIRCVSVGGTPLARSTHLLPEVTELRVGTYAYNDARCLANGTAALVDCALLVRATVVSRPTPDRAILDAGSKALTNDPLGADLGGSFGRIVEYPHATIYALSEEHGHVDVKASERRPKVGDVVTIVPNHACGAVNLHDDVALHRGGRDVEIARVAARGLVR